MILSRDQYIGYQTAMLKNGCEPISFNRLYNHVSRFEIEDYQNESAWIAGTGYTEAFFPSHGGYNSLRDMVKLISILLDSDRKIYLAVKENIGNMLQRCGWIYSGIVSVDYPYKQEKTIWVNHIGMVPDWRWPIEENLKEEYYGK